MMASFSFAFAQKLDDVKEKIDKKKYDEAREKIDKMLADPKNQGNADAWYYKTTIYTELAKANPADTALLGTAYDAMQKYMGVEAAKEENKRFLMSKLQGHRAFFDLYSTYFKAGADAFNAKNYGVAYNNFDRAVNTFEQLAKNNFTDVKFDTTSILYAGVAAESQKMTEEAARYYQRIVDLKIPDTSHIGIYGFMINYYNDKKDPATAEKYVNMGETLFPNRDVWSIYRLDMVGTDTPARLKKYEEMIAKNPTSYMLTNDYAVEMYRYVYYDDKRVNDSVWLSKLKDAFRGALNVQSTPTNNYILMAILADDANFISNNINRIRGTKPEDLKKKQALQAQLKSVNDEMAKYALATYNLYSAMPSLKASEKANQKRVIQNLIDYYRSNNNTAKVTEFEAKLKTL
jgi:tetratricopeptide (TPR) repeat protein